MLIYDLGALEIFLLPLQLTSLFTCVMSWGRRAYIIAVFVYEMTLLESEV